MDPAPAPTPSPSTDQRRDIARLLALILGAAVVGILLALGMRRRDLEADGAKPAKVDDPPPTDAHGHHEITPEMIAAAEAEKRAKREAKLKAEGFQPKAPAGDDATPIVGAPVGGEGANG